MTYKYCQMSGLTTVTNFSFGTHIKDSFFASFLDRSKSDELTMSTSLFSNYRHLFSVS